MRKFLLGLFLSFAASVLEYNAFADYACYWGNGCTMSYCTYAETIYDSATNTCPCSCLGQCTQGTVATQQSTGAITCEIEQGGQLEFDCDPAVACKTVETTVGGGSVTKVSYQPKTQSEMSTIDWKTCKNVISTICNDLNPIYMCNFGYYNLTGSGDNSTCTRCPTANQSGNEVWTNAARTSAYYAVGTTTTHVNANDVTKCCLPADSNSSLITYYNAKGDYKYVSGECCAYAN